MAERVAQTTRVLESRRFLKLVYVTILAMISLVIVIIALIIIENKNLKDDDLERFDQIMMISDEYNEDLSQKQLEIDNVKTLLYTLDSSDEEKRSELLSRLIDAYGDQIEIIDSSLFELGFVDDLTIPVEMKNEADVTIYALEQLRDTTETAISKAQNERTIAQYLIEVQRALKCFDNIDTNKTSSNILSAVNKCEEYLASASSDINTISAELTLTNNYLESISDYWSINVDLHKAIEGQDEVQAAELTNELSLQEAAVQELESSSKAEITEFLAR